MIGTSGELEVAPSDFTHFQKINSTFSIRSSQKLPYFYHNLRDFPNCKLVLNDRTINPQDIQIASVRRNCTRRTNYSLRGWVDVGHFSVPYISTGE